MMIMDMIVMKKDVIIDANVEDCTLVTSRTKDFDASKIVCLQEKAIVNARVTMIKRRIWRRNSDLKLLPPMKKL